jgi:hypothetical protein
VSKVTKVDMDYFSTSCTPKGPLLVDSKDKPARLIEEYGGKDLKWSLLTASESGSFIRERVFHLKCFL